MRWPFKLNQRGMLFILFVIRMYILFTGTEIIFLIMQNNIQSTYHLIGLSPGFSSLQRPTAPVSQIQAVH